MKEKTNVQWGKEKQQRTQREQIKAANVVHDIL